MRSVEQATLCGLVLAGGQGERLRHYIRSLGKGSLPKQYVNFTRTKELLEPLVEKYSSSVVMLPVRDVYWSDWGTPARVVEVLRKTDRMAGPAQHRSNRGSSRRQLCQRFTNRELRISK